MTFELLCCLSGLGLIRGLPKLKYIDTRNQLADILTEPLDSSRFAFLQGEFSVYHPYGIVSGGVDVFYIGILTFSHCISYVVYVLSDELHLLCFLAFSFAMTEVEQSCVIVIAISTCLDF